MNKPPSEIREIRPDGLLERDRTVPYPISNPIRNRTVSVTVSPPGGGSDASRNKLENTTVPLAALLKLKGQNRALKTRCAVAEARVQALETTLAEVLQGVSNGEEQATGGRR
jgi:hypothetical protein